MYPYKAGISIITNKTAIRRKCFVTQPEIFDISGISTLCFVFSIALSQASISAGRIVTHPITPMITPLAITIPRSRPSVKLIKHNAMNPATVVTELPVTETIVWDIACAIARFLSPSYLSICS